jgi:hypothetical protein
MMGTNVLFQVRARCSILLSLMKYMELGKCCLPEPAAFFENI